MPSWIGIVLASICGGTLVPGTLAVVFRKRLITPEVRQLDAKTRAEDASTDIRLSQEARAWLDAARQDIATSKADAAAAKAEAAEAHREAAAARSEAVAAWRDREAEARKVRALDAKVTEQGEQIASQGARIDQLEGVIREARLALPPWPARRGYPRENGN